MQKIFLLILLALSFTGYAKTDFIPQIDLQDSSDAFWPPDMIPHPNPPWDQPSGPGDPELA